MLDTRSKRHAVLRKKGSLKVIAFVTMRPFLFITRKNKGLIENARVAETPLELTSVSSNRAGGPGTSNRLDLSG